MRDAELGRDRADRRPLRGMLILMLEHHADGPLPQLLWAPPLSGHGSNLSRVRPPRKPGGVHPEFPWMVDSPARASCASPISGEARRRERALGAHSGRATLQRR